ncbi:hypothetical protein Tco_0158923 [Tanacetum coccineum]
MVEEPVKKLSKKKYLIRFDEEIALKLQAEFDEEERLTREKDEANVALTKEWDDIQAKVDADYQLAQRLQAKEQEQFTTKQKATLFKELLEQRRKHFVAKRAEEKRNKPPTQAQQRKIMCQQRKIIDFKRVNTFVDFRIDLVEGSLKRVGDELEQEVTKKKKVDDDQETAKVDDDSRTARLRLMKISSVICSKVLTGKLVKAKYGSTRPVEDLDLILWGDLKTMFEPHVEDRVWKNQQDYIVLD